MARAKLDIAALAQKLQELNTGGGNNNGGMNFLTIKDGRNVLRVLPARVGADWFYEESWVHYGVGKSKENKNGSMVVCPKTKDENAACPVCELSSEIFKLSTKKDDDQSKQAKAIYRKKRVYFNVLSRDEDLANYELRGEGDDAKYFNIKTDKEESPVKVYGAGVGILKDIIAIITDPEYGDITDEEEGLDLIITKTGSGQFGTKYDVKTVRKETPIGFDAWESELHDLSALTKVTKDYDAIAKLMDGEEPAESDEEVNTKVDEGTEMLPDKTETDSDSEDLSADIAAAIARRKNR